MQGKPCTPFVTAEASSRVSSVFDNGLPLESTPWIDGGVLSSLLQTRHSASVTGLETTPYIDNLELVASASEADASSVVAGVERGLLLTCLWYIREVDPQT